LFAKSSRDNIDEKEERNFKDAARVYLGYTDKQLKGRIESGQFKEMGL
jgi:hypothetical protein